MPFTGDMAGKTSTSATTIDSRARLPCRNALATGMRTPGGSALKGSRTSWFPSRKKIESGPVQIRKRLEHQGGGVGGIGNEIAFSFQQRFELLGDFPVNSGLGIFPIARASNIVFFPDCDFGESRRDIHIG